MAKLVDAVDSKSTGSNPVPVRVWSPAFFIKDVFENLQTSSNSRFSEASLGGSFKIPFFILLVLF